MSEVADDRWSCTRCGETTEVIGSRMDVAVALSAVREHHRCEHQHPPTTGPMRAVRAAKPIPPIPNTRRSS